MFIFREPEIKVDGVYYQTRRMEEGTLQTCQGLGSRRDPKDADEDGSSRREEKCECHGSS